MQRKVFVVYSSYQSHTPLNVFAFFETQFGSMSINCFHNNSPVHLAAVQFIRETFD